jgi:hypothetical protein
MAAHPSGHQAAELRAFPIGDVGYNSKRLADVVSIARKIEGGDDEAFHVLHRTDLGSNDDSLGTGSWYG